MQYFIAQIKQIWYNSICVVTNINHLFKLLAEVKNGSKLQKIMETVDR